MSAPNKVCTDFSNELLKAIDEAVKHHNTRTMLTLSRAGWIRQVLASCAAQELANEQNAGSEN